MPLFKVNEKGKASKLNMIKYNSERELQNAFQDNLEELLGVKFIATEFATGEVHGGRIDTIGIDQENNPVIIEYKLSQNDNVLNQGLYYMDWLYDHKGDFESAVKNKLGNEQNIEWDNPKLIIIAQEYSKFDKHAVNRVSESVYLYKYHRYEDNSIYLENINTISGEDKKEVAKEKKEYNINREEYSLDKLYSKTTDKLIELHKELREKILNINEQIEERAVKHYVGYRTTKQFCMIIFDKSKINIYLSPVEKWNDPKNKVQDVPESYRFTLNKRISISSVEEIDYAIDIIKQSYEETL